MSTQPCHPWLSVEQVGDLTVVRFTQRDLLDEAAVFAVGEHLFGVVEEGQHNLIISFANVQRVASILLGKLVRLHRKLKESGGRLAICELGERVGEIFDTLRLSQMLNIYNSERDALESF